MSIFRRKTFKVRRDSLYRLLEVTGWGSGDRLTEYGHSQLQEAVRVIVAEIEKQR